MAPQTLTVEVMKPGTHVDMRGTEEWTCPEKVESEWLAMLPA